MKLEHSCRAAPPVFMHLLTRFDARPQQLRVAAVKKCLVFITTPFHNLMP
jgi:hypothetical protein